MIPTVEIAISPPYIPNVLFKIKFKTLLAICIKNAGIPVLIISNA